jgi:hypothetical protein
VLPILTRGLVFTNRIPGDFKFDPLNLGKKDFAKNRELPSPVVGLD